MDEKTREDWLEEAASWICYDGPTDMEGIMQELKNNDEIEDKDQYAAKLLESIDLLLDAAKSYGAECAGCNDLGGDPLVDMQRHLDTWGYSKPLETRPGITCGKAAEEAWQEGYLEARTEMYRTQKEARGMEKDLELTEEPLPDRPGLCFRQGGLFAGRKWIPFPTSLGDLQNILRDNSDWDLDVAPSGDTIVMVSGTFYGRNGKFIFLFDKDDNFDGLFIPIGVEVDRKDIEKVTEAVNESFASLEKTLDAEPYFEKHETPDDERGIIYTSRNFVLIISPDQDRRGLHVAIWRKPE